jgi:hypothetical protein
VVIPELKSERKRIQYIPTQMSNFVTVVKLKNWQIRRILLVRLLKLPTKIPIVSNETVLKNISKILTS